MKLSMSRPRSSAALPCAPSFFSLGRLRLEASAEGHKVFGGLMGSRLGFA